MLQLLDLTYMLNCTWQPTQRAKFWLLPVILPAMVSDLLGSQLQGAGAVAMLVGQNPRILELTDDNVAQTRDVMDFWCPNYSSTPYVPRHLFN